MDNSQENFLENLNKNGLLKNNFFQNSSYAVIEDLKDIKATASNYEETPNVFNGATVPFGNLTLQNARPNLPNKINNDSKKMNGLDTEILSSTKYEKMDDGLLKMQVKIAQLKEQLEAQKELVSTAYLKSDRNHYQKLQEIQNRMEAELQRLVADYQNRQLKSIVFSPFTKLFNLIKSYVVLR